MQIRVICRVRPAPVCSITCLPDGASLRVDAAAEGNSKDSSFSFDHVFGPDSSQEQVFAGVSELVQSALDGYKVNLGPARPVQPALEGSLAWKV